jgi:xanthine dehydrogenase accessory factor
LPPPGQGAIIRRMNTNKAWLTDWTVIVKGGGDLGTGVIYRLYQAGLRVVVTELPTPLVIRRRVALATAVYEGVVDVEGMVGRRIDGVPQAEAAWEAGQVPVLVDPDATAVAQLRPAAVVDAAMAKRNMGTCLDDAPVVIGLGPGFVAGEDVHAVIETQRGHYLGRVIYKGPAAPNSGVPGSTQGVTAKRVLRAPADGRFKGLAQIGDRVQMGQAVAEVEGAPVRAEIDGVLRGLLADGVAVEANLKVGDVDPRGLIAHCFHISDKALAVGGGALEALLFLGRRKGLF